MKHTRFIMAVPFYIFIVATTCYMCVNYSYGWLLLLLLCFCINDKEDAK